jgi:hypothetical protein
MQSHHTGPAKNTWPFPPIYQAGLGEGALGVTSLSKNGVSERAPYVAVESVIFHQLPTSVTHLCERDPQLLSRMVDQDHVSLGRPPALWCSNHLSLL